MKKTISFVIVLFMVASGFSLFVEQSAKVCEMVEVSKMEKSTNQESGGSRASLSPDFLYARNHNSGWLKQLNKDGSNIQNLVPMNIPGSQTMPCMTPDGQWVYARVGSTLYRYSTTNGAQTTYNLAHSGSGYAVGTDGIYLYYGSGTTIYKVTMTGNHISSSTITQSVSSYYFSVTDGAVWIASGNTWFGWSTNRFTGGNIGGPNINWNYGGISSTCMNFAFDGERYYVVAGGSSSMPMKVYDSNRNFIRQYTVNIDFRSIMCPYGGLSFAENTRVRGRDSGDDVVCYAKYESYGLTVNVTSPKDLDEVSEVKVHLDYNGTNATLCYNYSRQQFYKLHDTDGHVQLFIDECDVSNDGLKRWWINFTIVFNFTFPNRELVDCFVNTSSVTGEFHRDRFPYLFRVVKDLEFVGTPDLTGQYQGKLNDGDWVRGSEGITVSNLKVVYFESNDIYPDDDYFDVKVSDSHRNQWWDNHSSGEIIILNITTGNVTNAQEWYSISIENIPGSGECKTTRIIPLKIDNDPPPDPSNLACHADGFKDKEIENTDQPLMYVTWNGVEDPDSGLLGYYYSAMNNSGTKNGTFINVTQVEIDDLLEGYASIHVWCIDNVGNIGVASASGIRVDLTPPVFKNHNPGDGLWHNQTDIDCSVEILDGEGSGIDGSTIEYSVSETGVNGFNFWIPAMETQKGDKIIPSIRYIFPEGDGNYIKWRAKDISENGFAESPPVNIKVDITPISFAEEIHPQIEWYNQKIISTKIMVSDTGSGVDLNSLEARVSTSGPNDLGQWMSIDAGNINESGENGYEITVTLSHTEGTGNYIMFRGTDIVGNPYSLSDKFNLKIDTSPVYFGSFTPSEDEYSDGKNVECFIQIFDDGYGVDSSTVEYSVATGVRGAGAGGDEKKFGPWEKVVNVVKGNPTQVFLDVEFQWGKENFIRWRADDLMGTGYNESSVYKIWVNSKPEAVISSPDQASYFRYGSVITFDGSNSSDEDGDNLTYYWSSNISSYPLFGSLANFNAVLLPGKHTISLFVSDGHGYNESTKIKIEVAEKADYELDSDGDGFSDGLEREKGTDPNNRADKPAGEPDIVSIESAGILGGVSSLLFFIIGGILLLIILVLVILFIVKKRKKDKDIDAVPLIQPPQQQLHYMQPPYPPGQFIQNGQQGYGETAQFQPAFMGLPGAESPHLMLPPVPGITQFGPGQAQQQALYGQPGLAATAYSLPSFSTEQGPQNLERMALPPGPPPGDQAVLNPATPNHTSTPEVSIQPLTSPDAGALETPSPSSPAPISPSGEAQQIPPEPIPISPASPPPAVPGTPPVTPVVPPIPDQSSPPVTNERTLQCHSCGNNYTAEITQFPALVTCPVCQTQGVMESI